MTPYHLLFEGLNHMVITMVTLFTRWGYQCIKTWERACSKDFFHSM